ncbi:MAG TPA: hypothetical protein VJ276_10730 [Thermoanaerobaculia bacterium]|nr:hypothetical protein [Thermoanaerobaculia bacterium]
MEPLGAKQAVPDSALHETRHHVRRPFAEDRLVKLVLRHFEAAPDEGKRFEVAEAE